MQISVDRTRCTGLGICESLAPDVFEIDDDGELVLRGDAVSADALDEVRQAVEGCPTEALRLHS